MASGAAMVEVVSIAGDQKTGKSYAKENIAHEFKLALNKIRARPGMVTKVGLYKQHYNKRRKKMAKKTFKPGQIAPLSGQYEIFGPRGGNTGNERTVTKGEPLPPTPKKGQTYKNVDPTKHK